MKCDEIDEDDLLYKIKEAVTGNEYGQVLRDNYISFSPLLQKIHHDYKSIQHLKAIKDEADEYFLLRKVYHDLRRFV